MQELEVNMKTLIFTLLTLASVTTLAADNSPKAICDQAIVGNDNTAPTKCLTWLEFANNGFDIETKAAANFDYATVLVMVGKAEEATTYYQQAYEFGLKTGKPLAMAYAAEALARHYYGQKQYSKALIPLNVAIKNCTSLFGINNQTTVSVIALRADIKRIEKDYQGALTDAKLALDSIPKDRLTSWKVAASLHNVIALSSEKVGNVKEALASYLQAAQLMEKFSVNESIIIWSNLKAALIDNKSTENLSLAEERIQYLTNFRDEAIARARLTPNVSLAYGDSSVKQ